MVHGFRLVRKSDGAVFSEWKELPSAIVLPNGDHVVGVSAATRDLGDFELVPYNAADDAAEPKGAC